VAGGGIPHGARVAGTVSCGAEAWVGAAVPESGAVGSVSRRDRHKGGCGRR
jgi:hypothetical protein